MDMMHYDKIIITPCPSFYKNNLFNEISKEQTIYVVYTGIDADERNEDFFKGTIEFQHVSLPQGIIPSIIFLYNLLHDNCYEQLIVSGWSSLASYIAILISPRKKNACIVESTIYESRTKGIRSWLKRWLMRRTSVAYVCGKPHERLVRALGFKGVVVLVGGCGLLNYLPQPSFSARDKVRKFLFVGRLVPVKNLMMLISVFNELPQYELSIIGFGQLEKELKAKANPNIKFLGAIDNKALPDYYREADVFMLCSYSETWGLVVEEALNNGTPVIVSDCVGCNEDLVNEKTGLTFKSNDEESLRDAILRISNVTFYNQLREGVSKLDFAKRAKQQVESFLNN